MDEFAPPLTDPGNPDIWRILDDQWMMATFPIDAPSEVFGEFESFIRVWKAKVKNDRLPDWRDFELQDFEGWYGWLSVFDVEQRNPLRLRCRLWGTNLVRMFGYDLTNKYREVGNHGYQTDDDEFAEVLLEGNLIGYDKGWVYWQNKV